MDIEFQCLILTFLVFIINFSYCVSIISIFPCFSAQQNLCFSMSEVKETCLSILIGNYTVQYMYKSNMRCLTRYKDKAYDLLTLVCSHDIQSKWAPAMRLIYSEFQLICGNTFTSVLNSTAQIPSFFFFKEKFISLEQVNSWT